MSADHELESGPDWRRHTPDDYPRFESLDAQPGSFEADMFDREAAVTVGLYPHQEGKTISLRLAFGGASFGVDFTTDEARQLAESLVDAGEEIEEWQAENDQWP